MLVIYKEKNRHSSDYEHWCLAEDESRCCKLVTIRDEHEKVCLTKADLIKILDLLNRYASTALLGDDEAKDDYSIQKVSTVSYS